MRSRPWCNSSAVLLCFVAALLAGCQPASRSEDRSASDTPMFGPSDLRIHPFTSVKDWSGEGKPDGVEALIELQDRFRDPTKATGTVLFELYEYQRTHAEPRGPRLALWRGTLLTLEEQKMHWNRISRTYSFQLAYPAVRLDQNYVLQVTFEHAGQRLTNQVVLEMQEIKGALPATRPAVTQPAVTRPVVQPVTRPITDPSPRIPAP